jgi:hypothetical protein
MGRVRSYLKTCWQVMADRPAIRFEAAKPQELRDGRAFGRVTGCIVGVGLLVAFVAAVYARRGLLSIVAQPDPYRYSGMIGPMGPRAQDMAVPWSAGATLAPLMPICLLILAFYLTRVQGAVFRMGSGSVEQHQRAQGLAGYLSAPMVLLLPGLACGSLAALIVDGDVLRDQGPLSMLTVALAGLGLLSCLGGVLGTLYRVGQWRIRTARCGLGMAVGGVAELVGLWLLGTVVLLAVVPWCIGLIWIALDSLR